MGKEKSKGWVSLPNDAWIEIDDALLDMPMETMADWVDAERSGLLRDVWGYMAQAVAAWSWEWDPKDPNSFGRLTLREYRAVSAAVTKAMQDVAKN